MPHIIRSLPVDLIFVCGTRLGIVGQIEISLRVFYYIVVFTVYGTEYRVSDTKGKPSLGRADFIGACQYIRKAG